MNYGEILKNEREKKSISRYRLAKETGISKTTIKFWEDGKTTMTINNADKVFKALGVTITLGKDANELG